MAGQREMPDGGEEGCGEGGRCVQMPQNKCSVAERLCGSGHLPLINASNVAGNSKARRAIVCGIISAPQGGRDHERKTAGVRRSLTEHFICLFKWFYFIADLLAVGSRRVFAICRHPPPEIACAYCG